MSKISQYQAGFCALEMPQIDQLNSVQWLYSNPEIVQETRPNCISFGSMATATRGWEEECEVVGHGSFPTPVARHADVMTSVRLLVKVRSYRQTPVARNADVMTSVTGRLGLRRLFWAVQCGSSGSMWLGPCGSCGLVLVGHVFCRPCGLVLMGHVTWSLWAMWLGPCGSCGLVLVGHAPCGSCGLVLVGYIPCG